MSAPRILVVTPDSGLADQLGRRLETLGFAPEVRPALSGGEEGAALCVWHVQGEREVAGDRLPTCRVIVALPALDVATVVELLHRSDRVVGVQLADAAKLATQVTQILRADIGGLARRVPPGTQVEAMTVADAADKSRCQARIGQAVERLGLPRSRRDAIAQSLDEMVMNALYDAPVDASGRHVFEGVTSRRRVRMRTAQQVTVEWAHDDQRFMISVRDAFGSLGRDVVVRHLDKSLHAEEAVDRKAGGAGLGLYLMATAASAVAFHVVPGVGTEVVCAFDRAQAGLEEFGFFIHDAAGRPRTAPVRRRLATRFRVRRAAAISLTAAVAAGSVIAWPHVFPDRSARITFDAAAGTTIEVEGQLVAPGADGKPTIGGLVEDSSYRVSARRDGYEPIRSVVRTHRGDNTVSLALEPVAALEIESQPSDATVEIDGHPAGTTPLRVVSLAPGAAVTLRIARPGYRVATAHAQVPARGKTEHVMQRLDTDDNLVRVRLFSQPSGATVLRGSELATADRTFTPAELFVEAGLLQRFRLTMPKHADLDLEPITPARGGPPIEKGGELAPRQ